MPLPIDYIGTQNDDQTRSVDLVPIEPSIKEGTFLVTSMYGPGASLPLYRFPPVNVTPPHITGDPVIPSLLTCQTGQWSGSPSPDFAYQWMSNGVDIPGANQKTWMSSLLYDETTITCEVRAFSSYGEGYATTAGFYITRIEPIETRDMDFALLSGVRSQKLLTTLITREMMVTGRGAETAQSVQRGVAYYLTGSAADQREDVNASYYYITQGLASEKRVMNRTNDIGVVSWDVGLPLVSGQDQRIPLKNAGAEMGTEGWNVFGTVSTSYSTGSPEWVRYFYGGPDANENNIPYSYIDQTVDLWDIWGSDIDAGDCYMHMSWMQRSYAGHDQGNIYVEFYSAADVFLGDYGGLGLWGATTFWFRRFTGDIPIPPNTRKIKFVVEFNLQDGNSNDGYIDYIQPFIRKGPSATTRDYGPDFRYWRVNFTQSRSYSGGAFQELEMRDSVGGTDLCTGGNILKGSEGLGGLAAYAFDDVRNNGGYWAGEENGIVNGTSWIGYDFLSNVKPAELDFTARQGTAAGQFPASFILQGSDDGLSWINVQEYTDYAEPSSSQQIQFEVLDGPTGFMFDYVDPSKVNITNTGSSSIAKGNMYSSNCRIDIDTLSYRFSSQNVPGHIYLVRFDYSYSGGAITEILFDQAVSTNMANEWAEVSIPPVSFEVGDLFAIVVIDLSGSGGDSAHQYNADGTTYDGNPLAQSLRTWRTGHTALNLADINDGGATGVSPFLVDFKGTVF